MVSNVPVEVTPVVIKLPPVILPVALIVVLAISEPVEVIPAVVRLPPVILPVALIVVPAVIADTVFPENVYVFFIIE